MDLDISKVHHWKDLSERYKVLKNEEAKLRREICEEILYGITPPCSKDLVIPDLFKIIAKAGVNVSIDEAVFDSIVDQLTEIEMTAFKFKPTIIKAKYDKLPENCLFMEAIIEKPAMPTLKVFLPGEEE